MSGVNTIDKQYLLFYDLKDLKHSLKICVKECPRKTLTKIEDINNYYKETGVNLCKYDFDYKYFNNQSIYKDGLSGSFGPCPVLPIYERYFVYILIFVQFTMPKYFSAPVLNRCVPKLVQDVTDGILSNFYSFLNSWDTLEQILGDLYQTWKEMLCLAFLALVVSLFTICILHLLAALVSYIIMVAVTIASIAGTVFLWYTYFDIKHNLDKTNRDLWLLESVRNETAFFWYSIIATIITVKK